MTIEDSDWGEEWLARRAPAKFSLNGMITMQLEYLTLRSVNIAMPFQSTPPKYCPSQILLCLHSFQNPRSQFHFHYKRLARPLSPRAKPFPSRIRRFLQFPTVRRLKLKKIQYRRSHCDDLILSKSTSRTLQTPRQPNRSAYFSGGEGIPDSRHRQMATCNDGPDDHV